MSFTSHGLSTDTRILCSGSCILPSCLEDSSKISWNHELLCTSMLFLCDQAGNTAEIKPMSKSSAMLTIKQHFYLWYLSTELEKNQQIGPGLFCQGVTQPYLALLIIAGFQQKCKPWASFSCRCVQERKKACRISFSMAWCDTLLDVEIQSWRGVLVSVCS